MFDTIQNIKSININHKGREQKTNVNEEKEMRSGREKKLKRYKEGRNRREIWGETEKYVTILKEQYRDVKEERKDQRG